MTRPLSSVHRLVGVRVPRGTLQPDAVLATALEQADALRDLPPRDHETLDDLKAAFAVPCRAYYTLAAVSRRRALEADVRDRLLGALYRVRAGIERAVLAGLDRVRQRERLLRVAAGRSFFGFSAKQGVSIRFALASCVPTPRCGGRCYAHDGRDRELHLLFRAVLNWWLAGQYEAGDESVLPRLGKAIDRAVLVAALEAAQARAAGYERSPRIRFSHIGELASTPRFANALADAIHARDPAVQCVVYTRHPDAGLLDPTRFVVNFTLEGADDPRLRLVPEGARIVSSAWDGRLTVLADVNFLEHHTTATAAASGEGRVCPVTADHAHKPSCDAARCDRCFRPANRRSPGGSSY